ncbi:MAG: hypothetical protein WAR79_10855 [Melioribacteraceae bacterium]
MKNKIVFIIVILTLLFTSCGKNNYTIDDVLAWHERHSNDPYLDSLGYEQVAPRDGYVMISANYEKLKLRFIVDKNSTVNDFNYSRVIVDSDYMKDVKFPNNSIEFKKAENRAKIVFSYYLHFEKIEFHNYDKPDTIFGNKKLYFFFGEKLTLVYSPNRADKLINYFSKTPLKAKIIKIDNNWFLFSE